MEVSRILAAFADLAPSGGERVLDVSGPGRPLVWLRDPDRAPRRVPPFDTWLQPDNPMRSSAGYGRRPTRRTMSSITGVAVAEALSKYLPRE